MRKNTRTRALIQQLEAEPTELGRKRIRKLLHERWWNFRAAVRDGQRVKRDRRIKLNIYKLADPT